MELLYAVQRLLWEGGILLAADGANLTFGGKFSLVL